MNKQHSRQMFFNPSEILSIAKQFEDQHSWWIAYTLYRSVSDSSPQNVHARRGLARVKRAMSEDASDAAYQS